MPQSWSEISVGLWEGEIITGIVMDSGTARSRECLLDELVRELVMAYAASPWRGCCWKLSSMNVGHDERCRMAVQAAVAGGFGGATALFTAQACRYQATAQMYKEIK